MSSSVSARKRVRQNEKNRAVNRAVRSKIKSSMAKIDKMLGEGGDAKDLAAYSKTVVSGIDKACKKGVLHKNTAARKKSRMQKLVNKLGA